MLILIFLVLGIVAFLFWHVPGAIGVFVALALIKAVGRHGLNEHPGHTFEGPYDPRNDY